MARLAAEKRGLKRLLDGRDAVHSDDSRLKEGEALRRVEGAAEEVAQAKRELAMMELQLEEKDATSQLLVASNNSEIARVRQQARAEIDKVQDQQREQVQLAVARHQAQTELEAAQMKRELRGEFDSQKREAVAQIKKEKRLLEEELAVLRRTAQ